MVTNQQLVAKYGREQVKAARRKAVKQLLDEGVRGTCQGSVPQAAVDVRVIELLEHEIDRSRIQDDLDLEATAKRTRAAERAEARRPTRPAPKPAPVERPDHSAIFEGARSPGEIMARAMAARDDRQEDARRAVRAIRSANSVGSLSAALVYAARVTR